MTHELQDAISRQLARRVAARLRVFPGLREVARANLARWTVPNADSPSLVRRLAEWQSILSSPVDDICDLLLAETEDAQRSRQNSPFVGILAPAEVRKVKHRLRLHATTPA
jgi:hypothetical protein